MQPCSCSLASGSTHQHRHGHGCSSTSSQAAAPRYATYRPWQTVLSLPILATATAACLGHSSTIRGGSTRRRRRCSKLAAQTTSAPPKDEERRTSSFSSPPAITLDAGLPPQELQQRITLCDSGLPDVEECLIPEEPPHTSAVAEALSRGRWLLGLLFLQSTSSFVLHQYEDLLRDHIIVTLFLTMLVGAGGNAGNQSAIKVIRALATGSIDASAASLRLMMADQAMVALLLGSGLSLGGFLRVYITNGDLTNALAISFSLFTIVMTSVVLGTGLPFALARIGIDPANAGTSIQVVMDILGVAITCATCQLVLVQFAGSL